MTSEYSATNLFLIRDIYTRAVRHCRMSFPKLGKLVARILFC